MAMFHKKQVFSHLFFKYTIFGQIPLQKNRGYCKNMVGIKIKPPALAVQNCAARAGGKAMAQSVIMPKGLFFQINAKRLRFFGVG
jgi:hypothetical protein